MTEAEPTGLIRMLEAMGIGLDGEPVAGVQGRTLFQAMRDEQARRFAREAVLSVRDLIQKGQVAPEFASAGVARDGLARCLRAFEFDAPDEGRVEAMLRLYAGLASRWREGDPCHRDLELLRTGGSLRSAEWTTLFALCPLDGEWARSKVNVGGRRAPEAGARVIPDERRAVVDHLGDVLDTRAAEMSQALLESLIDKDLILPGRNWYNPDRRTAPSVGRNDDNPLPYLTGLGHELVSLHDAGYRALGRPSDALDSEIQDRPEGFQPLRLGEIPPEPSLGCDLTGRGSQMRVAARRLGRTGSG